MTGTKIRMKILHIIPSYVPAKFASGPILPTHYLNRELVRLGVEVTVYTTNVDAKKKMDVPLGVPVDVDGVRTFYFDGEPAWFYSSAMREVIAKNLKDFDLAHITSVYLSASAIGAYYAKKFKVPYIISPHGSFMTEPLKHHSLKKMLYVSLLEKKNLAGAAALHFVADTEKEDYLKIKLPLRRALVIPNGLDLKELGERPESGHFRKKFGIVEDKKIVLFLARLHPIKGLDTLIPAFAEVVLKDPAALLILAGYSEEGYLGEVRKMISENGLGEKVMVIGPISGKDKLAALLESDIFVLPSYSEACSMALIEAMHFGLPPVMTKGVGFSKEINEAGAGIATEKEAKALAVALSGLLEDEQLRHSIGAKARIFAEKEFSISKVAQKFINVYNSVINER